jgi:hypothetical protein
VRVLNQLKQQRRAPRVLFCDNGAEFTGSNDGSVGLHKWTVRN